MRAALSIGTAFILLAPFWAPASAGDAAPAGSAAPMVRGRALTAAFYEERLDTIWQEFDDGMKGALGSIENLRAFRQQVGEQLGAETAVVDETVSKAADSDVYVRLARYEKIPQVIEVVWAFNPQGAVQGFVVRPRQKEADSPHLGYETKTHLRLPFEGEWTVFWGGRSLAENYHAATRDQRFALDLVVMMDGSTHNGDGSANTQYHCYGRPVLAPAPGVVAAAVDGIADNVPGETNRNQVAGNHVILDHGNGEFSFLAHFRQGSLRVRPGMTVVEGDSLGLCGNSGNSSEPHLHYHLQTTPVLLDGEGLPAQFLGYLADGKPIERGEPVKGQRIAPAARE